MHGLIAGNATFHEKIQRSNMIPRPTKIQTEIVEFPAQIWVS
jgi:hypothetical protein